MNGDRDRDRDWAATLRWVERGLPPGHRVRAVTELRGGWTSRMRRLDIDTGNGPGAGPDPDTDAGVGAGVAADAASGGYALVLRSFVKPFYRRHAPALLTREAGVLRLLADGGVPAARLHALDAAGEFCDHPSLVMSLLPGGVRVAQDGDVERRAALLAGQLAGVHALAVAPRSRPRAFEAWTAPERVRVPEATARPGVWRRAVEVIRREVPAHRPCFLHRDFHPGNVLFTGQGADLAVSGVVDWVETSWGPADLDVAHCSTALALLHGVDAGLGFAPRYRAAGGTLEADPGAHLYWRLLDALAFAPDAEKVAVPWRELGRTDLTPALLGRRLEDYLEALLDQYA